MITGIAVYSISRVATDRKRFGIEASCPFLRCFASLVHAYLTVAGEAPAVTVLSYYPHYHLYCRPVILNAYRLLS